MATKKLNTRIALKYDSYDNWVDIDVEGKGGNLVLLKGELGICEIPSGNASATTAPTVLFKVGDGATPFKDLTWASAKAADVYSWAKQSEADFKIWLNETAKFATDAEVAAVSGDVARLAQAISDLEAALGSGDGEGEVVEGTFVTRLATAENKLATLQGEGDGSVKKALADAKAEIKEGYEAADTALGNRVSAVESRVSALETEKTAQSSVNTQFDARIKTIETFFDGAYAEDGKPLTDALDTLEELQNYIDDHGEVADQLLSDVSSLKTEVAGVKTTASTLGGQLSSINNSISTINANVTSLQELTGDTNKGNEALYTEVTRVANLIENETTGIAALLATTATTANKNKTDISALDSKVTVIEGDYLKASDEYIFNCGSSTTVTHK